MGDNTGSHCGRSKGHCGIGCQQEYGKCWPSAGTYIGSGVGAAGMTGRRKGIQLMIPPLLARVQMSFFVVQSMVIKCVHVDHAGECPVVVVVVVVVVGRLRQSTHTFSVSVPRMAIVAQMITPVIRTAAVSTAMVIVYRKITNVDCPLEIKLAPSWDGAVVLLGRRRCSHKEPG